MAGVRRTRGGPTQNEEAKVCWRLEGRYQLLLTRDKSLKTRGYTEPQLVNEGWLVLAVDLNLDACFVGRLICGYSM